MSDLAPSGVDLELISSLSQLSDGTVSQDTIVPESSLGFGLVSTIVIVQLTHNVLSDFQHFVATHPNLLIVAPFCLFRANMMVQAMKLTMMLALALTGSNSMEKMMATRVLSTRSSSYSRQQR